ncbi:MAG: TlpA disulfide reductase family protein [Desulfofustis sp.]|nr:TlpA disulfide reductase family protein [Desulfofustis sp.]
MQSATKMPAFKLEEVATGKKIDSTMFAGKSLLVTFFASWCPPCIQEIPTLIKLQKEYGAKQFSVIGLSVDSEKQVVRDLVSERSINYPVMMADNAITVSFGGVYGVPTSFLVNNKGTVVKRYTGYVPQAVLMRDLEQIID